MQKRTKFVFVSAFCLFISVTLSCKKDLPEMDPHKEPVAGMTEFVSADSDTNRSSTSYQSSDGDTMSAPAPPSPTTAPDESPAETSTVEEGDIYRVLPNNIIANLNSYRGLQLIDISDLNAPSIAGNLRINATPVEMYVWENHAYLLMNHWQSYYGNRDDITVERYTGGVVLAVDISDPAVPEIVIQSNIPGFIRASRMVTAGNRAALYIASDFYTTGGTETIVQSFTLGNDGGITAQSKISLGGYVQDIQATPEAMLVARYDWQNGNEQNLLAVIDISNTDGTMVQGANIAIAGRIFHKSNMDLHNGILRVVSGSQRQNNFNHLQTFDVNDINAPVAIDHDQFGENEGLEATLFLGNKAFFVTYFRQDPFHAFEIDDGGNAEEKAEYVISGWNDFFRAVSNQTRLIGIGKNDENGFNMAVSLYDITDLSNPNPFIARAEVDMDSSWSEATWDDRAFSVIENAVSVYATDVEETGLILLPFEGYKQDVGQTAGVQLFTFSDQTLTKRGVMEQNDAVRRSFLAQPDAVANISEGQLSLFDPTTPDTPVELSRIDLAPYYSNFMLFGEYGLRQKENNTYIREQTDTVQVITLDQHPEKAIPIATFEIPGNATIYHVGNLIVALEMVWQGGTNVSHIHVYDLSDPKAPKMVGSLTTDKIQPNGVYRYSNGPDVMDMPAGGLSPPMVAPRPIGFNTLVFEMENSLVLTGVRYEREIVDKETICGIFSSYDEMLDEIIDEIESGEDFPFEEYTIDSNDPVSEDGTSLNPPPAENEWYEGIIECYNSEGQEPSCYYEILFCSTDENDEDTCEAVEPDTIKTTTICFTEDIYTSWPILTLTMLDLTDPENPVVHDPIELPEEEHLETMLANGNTIYYGYKIPYTVEDDPKTYSKHYFKKIDFSDPPQPDISDGINIPGILLKIDDDSLYTHDFFWKEDLIESSLNRLVVNDGKAQLQGRQAFSEQRVISMLVDNDGHALVNHRAADSNQAYYLSILDTTQEDLPTLGMTEVDAYASMRDVRSGRVLFTVPGGLLIVNIEDVAKPFAQAFFPIRGWTSEFILHDMNITFAAGRNGIYQFELDENNLTDMVKSN